MNSNIVLTAGVIAAVVVSAAAFFGTNDGRDGRDGKDGLGAVSSIQNPIEVDNGGKLYVARGVGRSVSDPAVCIAKGPNATSTLISAGAHFSSIGTGGTVGMLEIGLSATAGATTTRLAYIDTVTGSARSLAATSTTASTLSINGVIGIVPPNYFLNVRVASTSGAVGGCSALFLLLTN